MIFLGFDTLDDAFFQCFFWNSYFFDHRL